MPARLFPVLVLLGGCCEDYTKATCGPAVSEDIARFVVTTTTGNDASDADISFCVRLVDGTESCADLSSFEDDFEENEIDDYDVDIAVSAGELLGFHILNRGGADVSELGPLSLAFAGNDWDLVGLVVKAELAGGDTVTLYSEQDICQYKLDAGDRYTPKQCDY